MPASSLRAASARGRRKGAGRAFGSLLRGLSSKQREDNKRLVTRLPELRRRDVRRLERLPRPQQVLLRPVRRRRRHGHAGLRLY